MKRCDITPDGCRTCGAVPGAPCPRPLSQAQALRRNRLYEAERAAYRLRNPLGPVSVIEKVRP